MKKPPNLAHDPAKLRRLAEVRLKQQPAKTGGTMKEAETQRLVHELQVHQIELEMQKAELQQARDALEVQLEKYTDLYDFAPVGYLTLDPAGNICDANLTAARLLGTTCAALMNHRFGLFVSPADLPVFNTFFEKVFAGRVREECDVSLTLKGKDPFEVHILANRSESGLACRLAMADITEQKLAKTTAARLAAIVQFSSDAIIGKDLNSIITSWNKGAEKIFGYTAGEMVGSSIMRLIPTDRHAEEIHIMEQIRRGENVAHFETIRQTKDGRLIDVSVTASPIKNATGKVIGVSKVTKDITDHKRAEASRLILNKLESAGMLAGGMAHDFNNLLTAVVLNLELALMQDPLDSELVERLVAAKKAALMGKSLTAQFVAFAEGNLPVRRPMFLTETIHESVRTTLSGSNIRGEFLLPADLWPAEVDAVQIGQVIRNLVLNAREAMPQGGVISLRAENLRLGAQEVLDLPPGDYVHLSIADQGGGIAAGVLPKIFDPYFSTKQRGTKKGMGLGLTISHAVIQKHAGAITVASVAGVGTTFHLYLPASTKLPGVENTAVKTSRRSPRRILVMDDEEAVCKVVGATLRLMGHEVILVADGRSAVEAYQTAKNQGQPFDLVILDLTVRAGLGGPAAMQALLKIDPTVKAMLMSGHANDPVVLAPERFGFKGVLAKPFDGDTLQKMFSKIFPAP